MNRWMVVIPGDLPTAWGSNSPIVANGRLVKNPRARATAEWLALAIKAKQKGRFPQFHGPIKVRIAAGWAHPKSHSKAQSQTITYKATKPDGDNVAKTVMDVLQGLGLFVNDAQASIIYVERLLSPKPGIAICITELGQYDPFEVEPDETGGGAADLGDDDGG